MKKGYFLIFSLLITTLFYGQISDTYELDQESSVTKLQEIEDFIMYPNPVVNGKLFINTANNSIKKIQIFDVLGKHIFTTYLSGKELNLSKLNSGIYILKINEENKTATRKLVIK